MAGRSPAQPGRDGTIALRRFRRRLAVAGRPIGAALLGLAFAVGSIG